MTPREIRTDPFFSDVFVVDQAVLGRIEAEIRERGFDPSEPLTLGYGPWTDHDVLVDGHTRLGAALNCGLTDVPVSRVEFKTREEALKYVVHRTRDRRQFTDAEVLRAVEALDKRYEHGGDRRSFNFQETNPSLETTRRSAGKTAEILGIGQTKVKQCRRILDCPDAEFLEDWENGRLSVLRQWTTWDHIGQGVKQQVLSGQLTVNQAYGKAGDFNERLGLLRRVLIYHSVTGEKKVKIPQHWIDRGWWPPSKAEMDQYRGKANPDDEDWPGEQSDCGDVADEEKQGEGSTSETEYLGRSYLHDPYENLESANPTEEEQSSGAVTEDEKRAISERLCLEKQAREQRADAERTSRAVVDEISRGILDAAMRHIDGRIEKMRQKRQEGESESEKNVRLASKMQGVCNDLWPQYSQDELILLANIILQRVREHVRVGVGGGGEA